jgi:membrane protein implicated in regulation of membrane protease activity
MPPGLSWLVGGLVLLGLEVVVPGAFMMWLGLAAFGTGLITLAAGLPFQAEIAAFAVLAALSLTVALRVRRRTANSRLNTPESGLVGRTARALHFEGNEGRVRVGDSDWPARLEPGSPVPPEGASLKVVGVDGTVVLVRPGGAARP